ncbi:MAG: hypothetical protein LBK99_18300 [Opitutaceae bacterium]|nr:hypothetical protein [Opitutaceae bacterium]
MPPLFVAVFLTCGSVPMPAQGTNTFDPARTSERLAPGSPDTTVTPGVKQKKPAHNLQSPRYAPPPPPTASNKKTEPPSAKNAPRST